MRNRRHIIEACLFIAGIMLLNLILREAYYSLLVRQDLYLRAEREFYRHEGPFDMVVLGDSYAMVAADCRELENAFNLSSLGEGYIARYYKLRSILRRNPKRIRTLVLPLDAQQFSAQWGQTFRVISSSKYIDYFDYACHTGLSRELLGNYVNYRLVPYANCVPTLYAGLPKQIEKAREVGMSNLVGELAQLSNIDRHIQDKIDVHYGAHPTICPVALQYLRRTVELCREHGIRVVFVRYPISQPLFDALKERVPLARFDEVTEQVVKEFPEALFLDYRELFLGREDIFADLDHLNAKGSKLFTERFRRDLIELGVLPDVAQ